METIVDVHYSVCRTDGYCPPWEELQEAAVIVVVAVCLSAASVREIYSRSICDRSNQLIHLKDDTFDVTLLTVYGIVMLLLVGLSIRYNYAELQMDVLIYNIMLLTACVKVKDSILGGIYFTALSYSSWYGLFRLLLTVPVASDLYVLLSPQWLSCLIAFTAPVLIANLKYPTLIQSSLALVTYGTAIFGLLVAVSAGMVFIDTALMYYDVVPGYGERIKSGAVFRLYGTNLGIVERISYYVGMVVLQFFCVRLPHILLDEDALQLQLREQIEMTQLQQGKRSKKNSTSGQGSKTRAAAQGVGGDTEDDEREKEMEEIMSDLPPDCVEISPEDAIALQESKLAAAQKATKEGVDAKLARDSGVGGDVASNVGGAKRRKQKS